MYRYSIWLQYSINSKTNESFLVTQLLIYQHPLFLFQNYMILPTILHYHSRVPYWFHIRRTDVNMFLESCGKMYRYHFLSYPIDRTFHLSSKFSVISYNEIPWVLFQMYRSTSLSDKGTYFRFCWIPSPCGIEGNERVDWLTKEKLDHDIDPLACVHYTDLKPLVNSYIQ